MSNMKIGWSVISITPDKKMGLAGQFAERISTHIEKPLTATAMAVEAGGEQMVLVSADLVGVACNLVDLVREELKDNTVGLDPMKVVFAAIHTHTAPVYPRSQRSGGHFMSNSSRMTLETMLRPDQKYVESAAVTKNPEIISEEETLVFLTERLTEVTLQAWENRKEGSFTNAFGRVAVGMCRRASYSDGSAQMWGDTNTAVFDALEGGNDSGIELLYVFDEEKKLTGVVANLACPAQCVQHRHFVSPDFWGEVKVLLRQHFGEDLFLLALCSAAGDQCPVDLVRWVNPESPINDPNCERTDPPKRKADPSMFDLAGMRKTGKRIAREIIDVYEEGVDVPQENVEFVHEVHWMQLPIRRATLTEVAAAKKAIKEYLQDKTVVDYNDAARLQVHLGMLKRFQQQDFADVLPTEVHIMRLGSIAIATNPFELFLDFGNQIKARSLAEQTFLIQLANGTEGYLPTEKAEKGGHYSAFLSSGQVGHVGGEQLVRQTLQAINGLF